MNKKDVISLFNSVVPFQIPKSVYRNSNQTSRTATSWFSHGTFQAAGLLLRLIFVKESGTWMFVILQICTQTQRFAFDVLEQEEGKLLTELGSELYIVPGAELCGVKFRWTCSGLEMSVAAIKPTPLKLPLVLRIEPNPPDTSIFSSCPSHAHTHGYNCPVSFEAHFQPSESALEPPAFLVRLHGGLLSDVTLRVGDKELRAHRSVLAAVSKVFGSMFSSDRFLEGSNGVVDVKGVRVEVMEAALRHVYGLELGEVDANTVVELLILSERYKLLELKALCEDLLSRDTTVDALQLLAVADTHRAQLLKEAVIARIVSCPDRRQLLSEESAQQVVRSNPGAVVELLMRV